MSELWTAVLPFKGTSRSKTRLDLPGAPELARQWLDHTLQQCALCPRIGSTEVVSLGPLSGLTPFVQTSPGLNEGLQQWWEARRPGRWLVLLPDLPHLETQDLEALLVACPAGGLALAPDRHGQGTNAMASDGVLPELVFGPNSLARFQAQPFAQVVVRRAGLSHDIDTLSDWNELPCPSRSCP